MRTKTESLARTNWRSLSLRSSSDMAAKQAVLAVKVADRAQADLVAAEKVADVVVQAVLAVDGAVQVVQATTDPDDLILTHNHKPLVYSRRHGNAPEFTRGMLTISLEQTAKTLVIKRN